jgi:23S rRNA pseudouridine2605 synthase
MAKRNSSGRSRSRSSSPPASGKKSFNQKSGDRPFSNTRKSNSGKPFRNAGGENAFDPNKRSRSTSTSGQKFTKRSEPSSGKEQQPPYRKGKSFSSSSRSERPYRKFDSEESKSQRPYKKFDRKESGEKSSFKKEGPTFRTQGPSTGLRRQRPYKRSEEQSETPAEKNFTPRKFAGKRSSGYGKKGEGPRGKTSLDLTAPVQTGKIRLNKFIANSGVCSRREADELIKMGIISVNGKTITELGYKVNPGDEVRHESKVLHAEKPVYILMNKPKGFLTTTSDPQERNTVMHLIGHAVKERIYPVGRLDRNTTGLLLLTNDGDLADKLMHPSYNAKKIYKVQLDRPLTKADAQQILEGIQLEEGKAIVDDLAVISEDKRTVGIEIHIGWNRVVRRIFEALNYEVVKLDRSVYAGLDKKDLGRGEWRYLTKEELVRLKHYK